MESLEEIEAVALRMESMSVEAMRFSTRQWDPNLKETVREATGCTRETRAGLAETLYRKHPVIVEEALFDVRDDLKEEQKRNLESEVRVILYAFYLSDEAFRRILVSFEDGPIEEPVLVELEDGEVREMFLTHEHKKFLQ